MIRLTSFREAKRLSDDVVAMSAARWAPDFARHWPKVEWAAPLYPDGGAIKLRDFGESPLEPYHEYMLSLYRGKWAAIKAWLQELPPELAICCWCPYTQTAKRQLREFGTFHCHLGVVAEVLDAAQADWVFGREHEARMVR